MNIHKHLTFTGMSLNPIKDPAAIEKALLDLVEAADMEVFIPPQVKYCEDPNNAGVTGTVVITTSHASVHVWDWGLVQADLYSCKDFDSKFIAEFMAKIYNVEAYETVVVDRKPSAQLLSLVAAKEYDMALEKNSA